MGSNAIGNRIKRTQNTLLYSVKASVYKGLQRRATFYYPIWWGEAPRIVATFVESYDWAGKTVVPFCTSGSSGIGDSAVNLQELASPDALWLAGERLGGDSTREEIAAWISGLGLEGLGE